MCEEANVYWEIYLRTISDRNIEEFCQSSPYYIGNTHENEEEGAYPDLDCFFLAGTKTIGGTEQVLTTI